MTHHCCRCCDSAIWWRASAFLVSMSSVQWTRQSHGSSALGSYCHCHYFLSSARSVFFRLRTRVGAMLPPAAAVGGVQLLVQCTCVTHTRKRKRWTRFQLVKCEKSSFHRGRRAMTSFMWILMVEDCHQDCGFPCIPVIVTFSFPRSYPRTSHKLISMYICVCLLAPGQRYYLASS